MGIRDSLSRLKERLEVKSTGRRRKPDSAGSGTDGERVGSAGSPPRLVPYAIVGGHDGAGGGSNTDERQVHLRDRFSQPGEPESTPNNREGGGADVGGGEVSQRHSCPDIEVVVGSGPGQEVDGADGEKAERVHPSSSVPSIPLSEIPDGV